jgi:hypothetical protein
MKKSIIILLIFTSPNILGQGLSNFFQQNKNLKTWFIPATRKEKKQAIMQFKNKKTFDWIFYNLKQGKDSIIDNFNFIDFNHDGIKDMIYQGSLGAESDFVVLLEGTANGFIIIKDLYGKIYWANKPNDGNLRFKIWNYPCCAGRVDFVESYSPKTISGRFEYLLLKRNAFIDQTRFPEKKMTKPIKFETVNEIYTLRITPNIDEKTIFWGHEDEKGNAIAYFPKGSTGTALASATDKSGRIWWFVLMTNNKGNKGMFMNGDNSKKTYGCYGWMSSRYVKIIH